jgi:hypothetical protein
LFQQRRSAAIVLIQQGLHQMGRFNRGIVATHGEALGLSERLLETTCKFVHAHMCVPVSVDLPRLMRLVVGISRRMLNGQGPLLVSFLARKGVLIQVIRGRIGCQELAHSRFCETRKRS